MDLVIIATNNKPQPPVSRSFLAGAFRTVLGLQWEEVANSFDVKIIDGLGAFCGLKEGYIVPIIHEEVFCQDGRAPGMSESVEVLLDVGISVSIILPDVVSGELGLRRIVQASC